MKKNMGLAVLGFVTVIALIDARRIMRDIQYHIFEVPYFKEGDAIVEINEELFNAPELINQSPYEKGYFFVVEMKNEDDLKSLLNAQDYTKLIEG